MGKFLTTSWWVRQFEVLIDGAFDYLNCQHNREI